ncbi:amino acid/polyamine/organocation transporter, APC superfamily [Novosphingobium aromaticivorans DSM 12444]|uniref:Arginine/agmatine antiporter n=1 Tax=Novosphingobium aromaticivorans (strain ATCC 700278 / DSM 12444 / CCUG 56034 / CIP 105152 / NBRC 16084 / F199) TaxID=279238 RepID=Q2G7Q9_NOVAD|nr:amino acid permease [Novosphingobium aromaticivorans]ABD26114.1 amino acid/polyamine/organocation transporter, APC superfamily [Novosphingobium aromaticivorans DSM 12444]
MNKVRGSKVRGLGFWMTLALVVGNMIGSGIYILPATLAPLGFNQLIGWAVTLAGALCLAAAFARMGARLPLAGGPYAYAQAAFGPIPGFVTAWSYWTMLWAGNGAVAVALVSNLSLIAPWIGATPAVPALLSVGFVWLLTLVNIRGVRAAGDVSVVTTALKLVPLAGLIGLAIWLLITGAPTVVQPEVPLSGGVIATAAGLTFWGFLGLESATVPADKVENARTVVPRATLIGVAITGLVYMGISGAFALYMPMADAAASPAPVADFLARFFGSGMGQVVALFAAISAFGTLNGFILLQGEVPWAMARGGVFPRWFAAEGPRGTPVRSHVVSSILLSIVTLLNYGRGMGDLFAFIASVSLAAGMLSYFVAMLAAVRLLPDERPMVIAALVGAAFIAWAAWGLGAEALTYGAGFVALGLPVYLWIRRDGAASTTANDPG